MPVTVVSASTVAASIVDFPYELSQLHCAIAMVNAHIVRKRSDYVESVHPELLISVLHILI
jgi:hypothetical protein